MTKFYPYILILLGLIMLLIVGQPMVAGVCFILGIVKFLDTIWPEKWEE